MTYTDNDKPTGRNPIEDSVFYATHRKQLRVEDGPDFKSEYHRKKPLLGAYS
ncbi:hypothetical protein DPMN_045999 [Dreissena polymorpha]|uniref:Uncharacterized protein n=1 Tax=Dreissena polymorpha TaxID=45954 RepID=A0A9D4D735_DREPO|nr:hypothetical protein DPMN_045999 [Dreissena polymorpha]